MTVALALALYFVIWWMTLFAVLPFAGRTQGEVGVIVPGTPESAPASPRLRHLALVNTGVATVVFIVVVIAMYYDVLGISAMVNQAPGTFKSQ